jgi:hypothetical protein
MIRDIDGDKRKIYNIPVPIYYDYISTAAVSYMIYGRIIVRPAQKETK